MAEWSGIGGHIVVGPPAGPQVPVRRLTFRKLGEIADRSTSASAGWRRRKGVYRDSAGTFDLFFDELAMVDVHMTLDINDEATLLVPMGASGKNYTVPVIVQELSFISNADSAELIGLTVSWVGAGPVVDPVA